MAIPLFGKKKNVKTIQQYQSEFNNLMFQLGTLQYQKHMANQQVKALDSQINQAHQQADKLGKDAQQASKRAQEELAAKVKEGQAKATTTDEADEPTKA